MMDYLFPARCRHCKALQSRHALLCSDCQDHFTLLDATSDPCDLSTHASCFDPVGPVMSLVHSLDPATYKLLASLFVVQLDRLNWPNVDCLYSAIAPDLTRYVKRYLRLRTRRFALRDRILLVPTIWPLTPRQRHRLYNRYPRQIYNLSIISDLNKNWSK